MEKSKEATLRYLEYFRNSIVPRTLSSREFEVLIKKIEGLQLTQTERNYLSRSIRKKLAGARIMAMLDVDRLIGGRAQQILFLPRLIIEEDRKISPLIEERIISKLYHSKKIAIITGAGISTASGIRTFRGKDGMWDEIDPLKYFSSESLKKNKKETIRLLEELRQALKDKSPNPAHTALALMGQLFDAFSIITQNIDGLHRKAGNSKILELHGNIFGKRKTGIPAVTLFNEEIDSGLYKQAYNLCQDADIIISCGTSAYFPYIRELIENSHAFKIEINPERTEISSLFEISLREKAEEILPLLYNKLLTEKLIAEFRKIKLENIDLIYLFGSITKRKKIPNDVDVAVICQKQAKTDRIREIIRKFTPLKANITIYDKKGFYTRIDSIKKDIVENGILLYRGKDYATM